jgi:hypothetical protein
MRQRVGDSWRVRAICLLALVLAFGACSPLATTTPPRATPTDTPSPRPPLADFPTVDPSYIYDQLFYLVSQFPHREAGYDNNLPATQNGHDEFAAYWAQEMARDLQGFAPQARRDAFPVAGWVGRPAVVPAFNEEVSVPGVTHPDQVVVIGCHYDAEAISTQSANDDASGCAIELGVAKALGNYWRSHHVFPARTLRFVIFDAEEQGLFGSFHYLNSTVNGDLRNIVAMFNEEQSGIAYPLRFLGKTANPQLPLYVDESPLQNSQLYPHQDQLTQTQRAAITRFRALMQQAVPAVFQQFRALGMDTLAYHGAGHRDVSQAVFTTRQLDQVKQADDELGASDQVPFTLAGLACATFAGNSTYYEPRPPPWSYPYDQAQDTIQLMNVFASGSSHKAPALVMALGLPGMLTSWILSQPDILGQVAADANPIAAISDVGPTVVNQNVSVDAAASLDPVNGGALTYSWSFGDGASGAGVAVTHTYAAVGTYTLKLTVRSASGSREVTKTLDVTAQAPAVPNPYASFGADGHPPSNPAVILPTPVGGP